MYVAVPFHSGGGVDWPHEWRKRPTGESGRPAGQCREMRCEMKMMLMRRGRIRTKPE